MLDADWPRHIDEPGNFYISSPCQRVRLGFLPEGDDNGLWKITVSRSPFTLPRWAAVFDDNTPVEIVSAFTNALVADYTDGRENYLYGAAVRPDFTALLDAGWTQDRYDGETALTAPGSLAGVVHRLWVDTVSELRGGTEAWTLWGGPEKSWHRWYATFTASTPGHLVAAAVTAMTDPAPVVRAAIGLPRHHLPHVNLRPVQPPIPTPLDVRRALAARARITTPDTHNPARPLPPGSPGLPAAGRRR